MGLEATAKQGEFVWTASRNSNNDLIWWPRYVPAAGSNSLNIDTHVEMVIIRSTTPTSAGSFSFTSLGTVARDWVRPSSGIYDTGINYPTSASNFGYRVYSANNLTSTISIGILSNFTPVDPTSPHFGTSGSLEVSQGGRLYTVGLLNNGHFGIRVNHGERPAFEFYSLG